MTGMVLKNWHCEGCCCCCWKHLFFYWWQYFWLRWLLLWQCQANGFGLGSLTLSLFLRIITLSFLSSSRCAAVIIAHNNTTATSIETVVITRRCRIFRWFSLTTSTSPPCCTECRHYNKMIDCNNSHCHCKPSAVSAWVWFLEFSVLYVFVVVVESVCVLQHKRSKWFSRQTHYVQNRIDCPNFFITKVC